MKTKIQEIQNKLQESINGLDEMVKQLNNRRLKRQHINYSYQTKAECEKAEKAFDELDNLNLESIQILLKRLQDAIADLKLLTVDDD